MFKSKFWLAVIFVYQFFSTLLIAIGVWPTEVVYFNLAVQLGAVLFFDIENAVYSVILSIPFYLVIPNPKLDSFSAWRIVFLFLFAVFLYKKKNFFKSVPRVRIEFLAWDKYFKYLFYALLLSVAFADQKVPGLKKLAFGINIYFLYVVVLNVFKTNEQILKLIKVSLISFATIVLVGFAQLFISVSGSIYYFWQYWATFPSRVYYGSVFADTATYSNSWFAINKTGMVLRMFSILPDSHAFAVVAMFSIPYAGALLFFYKKRSTQILLWAYIALATLAISFSGTRGVWAGILAPTLVIGYLYFKHYGRDLLKPIAYPLILFYIVLVISPLTQRAVYYFAGSGESFLQRAETIYDLNESSNAGRIQIWKNTLKLSANHPLVGVGYGNFHLSVSDEQSKALNLPKQYITAHSQYFDFLAEAGVIGLVFFILYVKRILELFWRFFKDHYLYSQDGYVFFAVSMGLYFLWLFAYSLFDGTIMNDRVLMFFFVSLAISGNIMRHYQKTNHA